MTFNQQPMGVQSNFLVGTRIIEGVQSKNKTNSFNVLIYFKKIRGHLGQLG